MTVATRQCAAALTDVSTRVVLGVLIAQTVTQDMFVAKRLFLLTKLSALRTVSSKLVISTMIVLVMGNAVDQGSVQAQAAIIINVLLTRSAIKVSTVAKRRQTIIIGVVVAKVVLARFVARMKTAGVQTNVVFLTSVLIVAVLDALQTQTAVQDSTVVRKDNGMNLVSAVLIVSENLVIQTTTVADPVRHVTLIFVANYQ